MTAPNPDQPAERPAGKSRPAVEVLSVGTFTFHDELLGETVTGVGVVREVGQVLQVRPLAGHYVQVNPADFTPLSADDV